MNKCTGQQINKVRIHSFVAAKFSTWSPGGGGFEEEKQCVLVTIQAVITMYSKVPCHCKKSLYLLIPNFSPLLACPACS